MNRLMMTMAAMTVSAMTVPMFAQDQPKAGDNPATAPMRQAAPGQRERALSAMRQQLSPEQLQRSWELQAKGTAARLGLDETQTSKLVEVYSASRATLQAESEKQRLAIRDKMQEARDSGGEMPDRRALATEMQKAMDDAAVAERSKFEAAIATSLDAKQVEGAMQSLGAMAPMVLTQWDGMVNAIADLALEADKNTQAMAAMEKFVISASQVRGQEGDDARTIMASARTELESAMKSLLNEEQYGLFRRTMGGPRERGRGDGATRGADPRRGQQGQGGTGTGTGTGGETPR